MLFIKLVRVLGIGVAAGLICHLLYTVGRKGMTTRPRGQEGKEHRKYVESSVVDKKGEPSDREDY